MKKLTFIFWSNLFMIAAMNTVNAQQYEVFYYTPENGELLVTANGETVESETMVDYGTVLTITATPDDGYMLDYLEVDSETFTSGGTYSVTDDVYIDCYFIEDEDSGDTEGNTGPLHWSYDGGVLTITGEGDMPDYGYGGKPWNHLGSMINYVDIAEGVTGIGNYAFQSCSFVDSVAIPNSVTRIGNNAFYLDGNLKRIFIGSGVTTIGENGFGYCMSASEIVCYAETPPTITANSFAGVPSTCVLKVYSASLEAYSEAEYWSNFSNIVPIDEAVECEIVLLTTAPDGTAGGEVAGGGIYMSGEECIIQAIPNPGYTFIGWMMEDGIGFSYDNPHTFTVERSMTLTASFGLEYYTVTYGTPQHGTLAVMREYSPEPVLSGGSVAYSQILTITATPDADYAIETLKVNGADFTSGSTHTVTGDVNIECAFEYAPAPVTVTFNTPENGTLTVIANGETVASGETVARNTVLTITATPDADYAIETLKVNGTDFTSGSTHTATGDVNIECVFEYAPAPVTVTFNTPENGTLTVIANGETVASGETVARNTVLTITATPDADYAIETLKVNGTDFTSGSTHTVTGDVNIECTFKEDGSGIERNGFEGVTVYSRNGALYIVNGSGVRLKSVQVIDLSGRVLYAGSGQTRTEVIRIPGAAGYCMVQLVSEAGQMNVTKVNLIK